MTPSALDKEDGFTLIEVLVALVVTGLLLGIVMNGALVAKQRSKVAADKQAALLLASSLIAENVVEPFKEQSPGGSEGNLKWELVEHSIARDPRGFFSLAEIKVTVSDQTGIKLTELTTRKLKAAPIS